ncbi:hypothetical protein ACFSQ3_13100 [Sphingobacterium corticis]|uniref:Potassium transporter KefB n=1 Tax=Sphingobacterium corticis TaxID=1812823 RepID=A0ABW5NPG3_9SPHI
MAHRRYFPIGTEYLKIKIIGGTALGILILGPFLYGNTPQNDSWGDLWFIKPLILPPLFGAVGGSLYYYSTRYLQHTLPKWLLFPIGALLFAACLWIVTVLV